ncbi:MAG: L,D-transpeptidase [Hyphomicrobiales bacterium]|nr:L,D-transpeptidase [Hyphomicrobiales bacterium]
MTISVRISADWSGAALQAALVASASGLVLGLATAANAAPRGYYNNGFFGAPGFYYTPAAPARRGVFAAPARKPKEETKKEVGFGEMPKGPLQIVVSIHSQRVTLYSNGHRVAQGPVSTGVPGHPTPLGVFSVIEKDRHHYSNIYSGAPMPYMQRITWSGVALHEGVLPGYPASHGCIRMSRDFAAKLWPTTKLGARVIVARDDLVPRDFEHRNLFVPKAKPPDEVAATEGLVRLAQATPSESIATDASEPAIEANRVPASELPKVDEITGPPPADLKASEGDDKRADVAGSGPVAEQTGTVPSGTPAEGAPAIGELRKAVEVPQPVAPSAPAAPESTAVAAPAPAEAPTVVAPAPATVAAPAAAAPVAPEASKPAPAIDPAKPPSLRTKSADQPAKRGGQIAVFVSRKEKKIFVRQGFAPLFDMPITIDEPDQPLGTHVYTAMGLTEDGGMRWNLITVPTDGLPAPERKAAKSLSKTSLSKTSLGKTSLGKRPQIEAPVRTVMHLKPPSTAAQALDRVHMPPEAVERISELLVPGSSLVISDEGLGRETGRYTEFIVLTR